MSTARPSPRRVPRLAHWQRNLIGLCVAQLVTLIGFSTYLPLIPYYVMELGVGTEEQARAWQAGFDSSSAFAMMISAPIWGALADRYGRRVMLLRATAAGAALAFCFSLATSPTQLVVIRTLQGVFCGTVGASMTLVATETPEEHLGFALGVMQMIQFAGTAVGPLVGGVTADLFGYRTVFPLAASLIAIALVLILVVVRERHFEPVQREPRDARGEPPLRERVKALLKAFAGPAAIMILILGALRFAMMVLSPVLALYVKSLEPDAENIATLAGATFSAAAITSALAALWIGRQGDRFGQRRVLLVCVVMMAVLYVPQAWVHRAWQLLILRAVLGIFMGGSMPTANALMARNVDPARRGTMFGVSSSVQAGGRALGPIVGAAVANAWGTASVFYVTGAFFGVIALMLGALVKPTHADEPSAHPL